MGLFDWLKGKRESEKVEGDVKVKEDLDSGVPPQKREWKIGDKLLDRYEIQDIKRGGMGIVYIALDNEWNQMFAIKTFQPKYLWDEDTINRFMDEAETWTNLERHTNIVFANFVQKIEGMPCIFLEYIDGGDLSQWIGRLSIPQVLDFAIQFCNSMDYAYKEFKIIHRDIKPQNAMITSEGVLKVTDFGLAKAIGERALKEELGLGYDAVSRGSGTLPYMPPEQFPEEMQRKFHFLPEPVTTRSDIYSFGVTFYQVLTGRLPFYSLDAIFTQEPVNPAKMKPDVPEQFGLLLMKCLEKNLENRKYVSFADLMEKLIEIYNDLPREQKIFGEKYTVKGKKEPLTVIEWNNKGYALCILGRYQEAIACLDKAIEINPRSAEPWYNKGVVLRDLSRYQEALVCYEQALEINPRYAKALINRGVALGNLGRYLEAAACYDKAFEINPRDAEAWNNRGAALGNLGRHQEALTCYDKAIEINPRYSDAWNNKGLALSNLGRHEEEITCYDKAIKINPRDAEALINRGVALGNLGRHQEALTCYDKALETNPRYVEAWNNKGLTLSNLGRHEEEITCYDKAIKINPRFAMAWNNRGAALRDLGRFLEAMLCYDKALEINPADANAWNNKGNALSNLGRHEEALECYNKALEVNPRYADGWNNKGNALYELGNPQKAIACYDKALEINPRYVEAWYNKGAALGILGRYQEEIACCDKALEINPREAVAWNNKGAALYGLDRYQEALACCDKALEINPRDANALNNIEKVKEAIRQLKKKV